MTEQEKFYINTRLECLKVANGANMAVGEWSLIDMSKNLSDFVLKGENNAETYIDDRKFANVKPILCGFVIEDDKGIGGYKHVSIDISELIGRINLLAENNLVPKESMYKTFISILSNPSIIDK